MHILLVKTSSLGDVIHNLPVVSDLHRAFPGIRIDWCVEESFASIPPLHPGVASIIPVAIRRWRKSLLQPATWREIAACRQRLRQTAYDAVLDTQGLLKSAIIARQAGGVHLGYAAEAAREPLAARFYDETFVIPKIAHAVERNRWLAGAAFDYPVEAPLDYGISAAPLAAAWLPSGPYATCFSATSRADKLWPEDHWLDLGRRLAAAGIACVFPGGSVPELARAQRLAAGVPGAVAAPPLGLPELASLIAGARVCIGVDTGLTHLAAALKLPTVALYVATEPGLTGVLGTAFHRNLGGQGIIPDPEAVLGIVQQALG